MNLVMSTASTNLEKFVELLLLFFFQSKQHVKLLKRWHGDGFDRVSFVRKEGEGTHLY